MKRLNRPTTQKMSGSIRASALPTKEQRWFRLAHSTDVDIYLNDVSSLLQNDDV
jgi:hypothetical protein